MGGSQIHMSIQRFKSSLFKSWLLSYFLILLLPVLVSTLVYGFALKVIKSETNRANMALLAQLQKTMDGELEKLEKTALDVSFNNRIKDALKVKGNFELEDQYNLRRLRDDIKTYLNTNNFLDHIYIYFRGNEIAIDESGYIKSDNFYSIEKDNLILGFEEWKELMHETHKKHYMVLQRADENNEYPRSVAYLQTIPIMGSTNNVATLVQMVNESTILGIMKKTQWIHKAVVVILDSQNQVVTSTQPVQLDDYLNYETFTDENNIIYTHTADQEYAVCHITSGVNTWKYILLMPTNVFWEQAAYVRKIIYIALVLCFAAGGIISFVFAKRNYNPLHKLVQALTKGDAVSLDSRYVEYSYIMMAINKAVAEKNRFADTLEKNENILKNSILAGLLNTKNGSAAKARDVVTAHGMDPENGWFLVVLFRIDKSGKMSISAADMDEERAQDETADAKQIVSGVIDEIVNREHIGLMVDMGGDILACIMSSTKTGINDCQDIFLALDDVRHLIGRKFNVRLSVSAGNVHKGIDAISRSYRKLLKPSRRKHY